MLYLLFLETVIIRPNNLDYLDYKIFNPSMCSELANAKYCSRKVTITFQKTEEYLSSISKCEKVSNG